MTFIHTGGKLFIVAALCSYVCYWSHTFVTISGFYNSVHNNVPGPCHPVKGVVHGSEDIQVLPNGLAFFTSGMKKISGAYSEFFAKRKGQVLTFDFKNPNKEPTSLKLRGFNASTFSPQGLSIWNDKKNGKIFVYVVSHPTTSHDFVEKFLYLEKEATLVHQKSITDIRFHVLNDLVVIGEDEFYITNYHYLHSDLGMTIETFGLLKWGSVVYYDGKESKYVDRDLLIPNGINVSPDHKYVYVAHLLRQEILVYEILQNRDLKKVKGFKINTNADNLDVDAATGDIWVGAQPVPIKMMSVLDHPDPNVNTAPSQVLHVKVQNGLPVSMQQVFADDGGLVIGSTVAVHYNKAILIGTVYNGLMYCEIRYDGK